MTTHAPQNLFSPLELGPLSLSHRVVMAPLTRMRSGPGDIPNALMAEYYAQRASEGGLIISEATSITATNRGYLGAPGLYDDAQIAGWRKITEAIHAKGGLVFAQLWHTGRVSHADLNGGETPVGPSALPFEGVAFTPKGWVPVTPNRALKTGEIAKVIAQYRRAAERAKAAGFDGVELHAANGYLPEQFLQDGSNNRTDSYGGSVENRARFLLEATEALVSVWGGNRVAVRISPSGAFNGMSDSNPQATFGYVARELNRFGLAYLHVVEPRIKGSELHGENHEPVAVAWLRKIFTGTLVAAGGFEPDDADAIIQKGDADLVAFGRHFIANPDLPVRIRLDLPLNPYDRATFYGGDARGYTDYPFHAELATR